MRLLHTSDWHLGQTFYEFDRTDEHEHFLKWLVGAIAAHEVDVLLMSGDVFDVSNPSATAVTMFYSFLREAVHARPQLQIIVTAGNHDSPTRLEAPKPLLDIFNINIVGCVLKREDNTIDYEQLIIPIKSKTGSIVAWCAAVPFLRAGDYPAVPDAQDTYAAGVRKFYEEIFAAASAKCSNGAPIIAMGHLHAAGSTTSTEDKSERQIMGGVELIDGSIFAPAAYTALGHIHKPQRVMEKEHIRYSGSPIPMSFSEETYPHQVVIADIVEDGVVNIHAIRIPVLVNLLRIPRTPLPVNEALKALAELPDAAGRDLLRAPYLEVRVILDEPEPALRHKVETVLTGKYARLAKISVSYPDVADPETTDSTINDLNTIQPVDVFKRIFRAKYNAEPTRELTNFFNEVTTAANDV
jgi:DNA repair protein SbcD/Mre11